MISKASPKLLHQNRVRGVSLKSKYGFRAAPEQDRARWATEYHFGGAELSWSGEDQNCYVLCCTSFVLSVKDKNAQLFQQATFFVI